MLAFSFHFRRFSHYTFSGDCHCRFRFHTLAAPLFIRHDFAAS
jgi:hypothetical protein